MGVIYWWQYVLPPPLLPMTCSRAAAWLAGKVRPPDVVHLLPSPSPFPLPPLSLSTLPVQAHYQLMTAFPNKVVEDEQQTLEAAGLLGSVIIVKAP